MSKSRAITENFTRMVNSERWKTLSVEQQSKYKQEYDEMLDRALAEEQQTATPTTADTGSATEAQPPKSRQIAQNFNRMRETDRWKTGLTDEQRENYTEEAKALHRRALVEEGSDQTPDTKLNIQQEVWQPYMPPEEEKRMADPTVGTVGKALGKSLLRAPGNLASTIVGAGGVIADLAGKGLKNIPYLEGVGSKISEVGQDTINVSNTMDAWNKHYIPPEQTAPQNLQEFGDMTWGQKGVFLADQLPEQVATMFLPGMMGAKFGQAAVAGAKGAKAAGVLKPLTAYLTSKGPKAAQALGAFTGSTIQSAAEIGKSQMQEAGDTDALATMIAAPLAGKLESLVPASAEWLSGSFKGASRKAFSEAMKSPVTFLAHVSKEMLKNSTTESVTELMQESIQKYATELAKGERGQGVLDAAAKASNILREKGIDGLIAEAKKNETVGQLAMAAILGGVAGGVFEGTGRSFAGAKYLTSPVRRYDAMVNAQTDEEKKVAAEAWKKLTPAQMQSARQEAAFRTIFELDDDESDPETVKDNFNVLRELGADGYATTAQSAAANGWTPSESYQARMTEFLTENPEFATELEKISGAQAVKTAPKITQEKPYVNLEPKSNISGQNAPAKPQPNVVDLINQIAGGQGDEYDSYAQSLANAQEPDPETKRASAVGGDLETAPGIINAKDYQESPDELTRLFPPEDMFSTGKTEQGEVAGREIPGKGFAGKKTKIRAGDITTDGEYAIVELDSLQRNKQMGELQNRDRTREASQAQIESIAANPDPDMLISSDVFANDGPMVVGPDFVVESGNGRTEGLNLAYQKGSAGKYTQALVQRAAEFGLDPQAISRMKKPVLVRIRTGEVAGNDRSAFVSAANAPRQLQRSATEKAITDGQAILDFVGNLETTGSNINTAANRPFLAEFFNRVATPEERGALFTATGELSQDGLNRVRNAVFSAAYGSPDLLVNLTEDTDSEIKSIINGLLEAAPDTAALSGEAKRGGVHPVSLTSALADAAKKIAGLRQQGQKVEAYFQQGQFGDDKLSPEARMLLGLFSDLGSSKKINDFVRAFNQTVRAYGSPSQMQIPGMETEPPTIREVMTQAIRKTTPELESKIERWVQGPPSLGVEFSRKGQKPVDAGNQKLLDLLERIGQNADPETAQASSKLVDLINSIGDKAPEHITEGKPAGEKNRDQVKYFSQPKDPGTQAGVISREELENTARTIQANLEPTTGVKVVVLETTDELTEIIQEANPAADPVPSDVEGALFNNTAYLVRNNLPDAKRATEVAGHEIIGHFGLQAILGREFTSQLVELEKLAETDQQVKAELDRAEKDYFDEDESAAKNRRIALEEALARISEKYAADPDTFGGKVRAWFEQSIGKIRDALRVLGFDIKFTASDLANTIRSSKAAVTRDGSFNSASKGAALDSYEKLAEVDRQFEESGMGEIWRFAKKTASQTLNKEKFRRKLYKNPLWEFLTPEKQQELLENTELYKGGLERRLRQMQNKKIRTRQHKGTSISDMLINKYPETPYAPFMPDSGKASVEAFEIAKEIISNDPTAKVFRGQLDVKNLKTLNDASESETDANNRFLKNFAEYFKEAVDSISNNNLLVKYGGDEWDSFIVVSKEVTEEDVRRYLMVAHKKAVQHAISMGIKETAENPRAPQPRGLGESLAANYKSGYVTPGIEKLVDDYAKDLWKYLTGRGMGFRIGISEVKLDQSFNESAEEISKQHKAEKEGKSLDQKTAEEYRQIIDGNIARIRRGETPIRFSIKKRMAGDVSEGKGSLQEVLVEQRRPGRPGGESGEIRVPGDEGILPSRLEQLIEQIGAELPPQHKETGNKLLDILSSLGGDENAAAEPASYQIEKDLTGDPRFSRAGKVQEKDPTKQLTLDFFTADQSKTEDSAESVETKSEPPAPVLEKFFQEVEKIRLGSFKHNVSKITGPADVAAILAPIADKGRETFMTVVVNAKKKPIAVIKVSTGGRDQTVAIPIDSLGAVASIPDAAGFYIAHNHPSGTMQFSNADRAVARRFSVPMSSTGVAYLGSLILGNSQYKFSDANLSEQDAEKIPEYSGKKTTPILGDPEIRLRSDQKPLSMAKNVYDYLQTSDVFKNNESGIILVNGQNQILAEMAMPTSEMKKLRTGSTGSGAARILAAMDKANASGLLAVMKNSGKSNLEIMQEVTDVYSNLTAFASDFDVRMLDVMAYDPNNVGWMSARENGLREGPSPYFSRKTDPEKQPAKTQLEKLLEALPEKDISKKAKSKLEEILEALPDESPKYSYAGQKAKRPRGTASWKTAKAMLDAGEDAEAVRLKTGWFVNQYDQKPRFEIDDSKVELSEQLWQHPALKGRTTFELAGVINHPELFAAYPALKDIMTTIEIDPDKQESGSYLPGTPGDEYTYGREPEIQIVAPNYESAKNSLIHEIQHAIQEEEGFAKGGSPREFLQAEKDKLDMIMERISILNKEMENAVGTPRYKELMDARNELSQQVVEIQKEWDSRGGAYGAAFNKYQSLAGEIEARDSADRTELSREERKLYPPYSTAEYGPDEAIVRFSKAGRALRGSVQNVLDRYNDGDPDVATEEDLINEVEALLEDSDAASEPAVARLLSSIEKYRSEAEDDRLKYGMRGDVDAYTDEAMTSIRQFVEAGDAKFSRSNRANQPTLEFKKWFGNSKIVDDQGRPMVVYHGTNKKFNVFAVEKDGLPNDAAMFFSGSKKVAEDFAGMRSDATKGKPRVVEAYLNINNPAQIGNIDDLVTIDQLWKRAGLDVRTIPEGLADLQGGAKMPVWQWYAEEPAVWRAIEDAGFDGAVGTERGEPLYVAFSPTQAKSATDNRGTFDPENPDIRFSKQGEADPGFRTYSEMERTLTKPGMLPKKASKTDMVSAIQKHVGKFKKVELDESGLIDHIQSMQDDQVTSQDVADYLDMNRIELEEKDSARWRINTADDTAQKYFDTEEEAKAAIEAERKWVENDAVTVDIGDNLITVVDQIDGTVFAAQGDERGQWFDRYGVLHHASKDEAIAMAESKAEKQRDYYRNLISAEPEFDESRTQYKKYQARGGKKYRELLLTLPSAGTRRTGGSADVAGFGVVEFADNEIPMFQSLHWGEPNVLLHVRFNEREDADGNKVLFVEEIQSDWHQAGRKKGYRKPGMQKRIEELEAEIQEIQAKGREATQEDKQRWADLKNEHQNLVRTMTKGAPEAPMKQTDRWAMLGMKRMIQWAADNGFDKVAWAPGDEQAKRYDLSKQISEIIFEDNQSGGIGLARLDGPATNGQLIAFDKNKRLVINQHIQPEQLEDYIGKDAAKKLLEQQPQRTQSAGIGVRQRKLGGVNLKVGGEGMKAFYDGILKNETAKYIKKWGAKVGAVEIPIKDDGFVSGNDVMDEMNIPPGERQSYWANLASDEREELMNKYRSRRATAHGFDITPAMRQGVAAGQPLYSKKGGDLADQLDPNPEPAPTLTEESKSQATKVFGAIRQVASGLMGKTVSQRDRENPAFKRSQTLNPEADTDFELERKNKIDAATKARAFEDKTILDHLDADKNLITGMIRKLTPKGDLQDWLLKKAARVLAPYQAAKPIERILFTVGENIAWDGKKIVASPGIRSYNPETGEYEYKPSEHAAAAMHFFNMLSPEWQELMTERAKANEEYRQNFVNVVIPHRKAQTAIALLARYRQMGADRTALEGAEAEARSMLKALDGKIDQAEHNELKSLLEEVVSIPADRINKMVVRMESIIKQATGELKTPAQLQRALKSLNTNRGHYGYVHHFFESDRVPSQGKAFDAFGRVPNGWIEDVPGTQKIRTGAEGNKRNLLEADIAKEAKEAKAEAANNWMRDIEDQRGLLVEEFEDIPDDQMPEGYVGYENERPFRRRVFANFGKYRGQEIYLPVKTFDSYKLVKEKGVDDPSMKEFGETIAMLDGVANRMNEAMLYHTGKFARDLLSAPFHIIEFVRDWSFTSPTEIPFVIKALTKAIASQASAKTWQKSTPESHGEYSESLPYQNKSDKKSFLTRAGDAIGRLITKDLPVGSTVAAMLKEINLSGAADLPLKRIFESVGEQLAERRGLKGKARERFVYDMINQYAFVTQDLPPWLAWLRGQMPSKESRGAGAIMRLTIPFLGYSSRLAKQMLADPVSKGLLPMAKRLIGKKDADANFLREFSEASRPFFWLFFKSLVASGLGGLLPPEEEGIASDIQGAENLNPLARTHGRILWSQDDDPKGGENWLSVKGLGHLQVADALSDVVAGKSSVSDLSTEFLTIHPAMSWILGSVGVENPYDAKVPKGARAGRMLAQALVPQLTRYGPEMGKFFRAAAGNNTIPDAQKQSFFTAFFEQLGIPAGEVKVDRDGKLRTTRTALELLKQVGVNMRHIPYDMIAEAVDSELGSAKYYTDRLEMIQEYRDGDRDTDLSEREFIAQTLQTNKWTKIDDAERDMTKALVDRGQGALATLAKLRQKGVPVNAKPPKKKKDKGFGGSFGGKKFGGGFGSSFKKSPESKREEKVSDLEKKIQEIQSNQPKPKSWHDQLLDVIKSI